MGVSNVMKGIALPSLQFNPDKLLFLSIEVNYKGIRVIILGTGGNGGHILFQASKEMNSLNHLKKEENGHNGTSGRNLEKEGKCGDHR